METIRKALSFLSTSDRRVGVSLLALVFVGACLEAGGIGLFLPFISLIDDPTILKTNRVLASVYAFVGSPTYRSFLIYCCGALVSFFLMKAVFISSVSYAQGRFLARQQISISKRLLELYLRSPFVFHLQSNPANLAHGVINSVFIMVSAVYTPLFLLLSESFVLFVVLLMMLIVKPIAVLGAAVIVGIPSFVLYRMVRSRVRTLGEKRADSLARAILWLNQSFGGIKELKILEKEDFFVEKVGEHVGGFAYADLMGSTIAQFPRFFIETISVTALTIFVAAMILNGKDPKDSIPLLALFALSAVRLMPSVNRILSTAISIRQSYAEVARIYADFQALRESPMPRAAPTALPMPFTSSVEFREARFFYPGSTRPALDGISLTIKKGQSVAFVGASGAGKTTAVDALLGLFSLNSGEILVDGKNITGNLPAWRRQIGYIPQSIYLSDDSVRRNVAFGLHDSDIDDRKVWNALRAAQLADFVEEMPQKLDTLVGDRGVRLSGGQRQRIGIARALYLDPDVLVLDEATSALDNETERAFVDAIQQLRHQKTLIVVAHRLSTVENCDALFFLKGGRVEASGTFQELRDHNEAFRRFAST